MSWNGQPKSFQELVLDYLKDISEQSRLQTEILKDAFNSDIELSDVEKLEDCNDGT